MRNKVLLFARLFLLGAVLASCDGCGKPPQPHLGAWLCASSGVMLATTYSPDGEYTVYQFDYTTYNPNDNRLGGLVLSCPVPRPNVNGQWRQIAKGNYAIDYRQNPIAISERGQLTGRTTGPTGGDGFIRFVGPNTFYLGWGRRELVLNTPPTGLLYVRVDPRQFPR